MNQSVPTILFVTPHFRDVTNGPSLYTENLWRLFAKDADLDFHIVALSSKRQHEKIHLAPESTAHKNTYSRLAEHLSETVQRFPSPPLVHVNAAHTISPRLARELHPIVQVNDTEVCQWSPSLAAIVTHGLRRNAALVWRRRRERSVTRHAMMTVCNSEFTKTQVRKTYGLVPQNLTTIYKAIDLEPFLNTNPLAAPRSNGKRAIFIGSNWTIKGLNHLIDAVEILTQREPSVDISLDVWGAPSQKVRQRFTSLIESKRLESRIRLHGPLSREEAPGAISSADLLVIPSIREALGLVAIEALACGIPVVASRVGGLPEIVSTETGFLVEPAQKEAIASAIREAAAMELSEALIERRRESVRRFDVTRLGIELKELYQNQWKQRG